MGGVNEADFELMLVLLPIGLALVVVVSILGAILGHRGRHPEGDAPEGGGPEGGGQREQQPPPE